MRFAVKDILALTLVTGLGVAIYVKRQAISATTLELKTLQASTEKAAGECQEKERQIELSTRTVSRRATDLDLLSLMVDRVGDSFNQAALSMVEPTPREGVVSRKIIPTFRRQSEFRERTQIYVPANLACELQMQLIDGHGNPGFFEDLEEPRRHSIPLSFGDNLIEVLFDWSRVPNTFSLTNHTSAVSIRARAKGTRGENWSPSVGRAYNLESFSPQRGMTIFEGDMGFKKATRIVVQMVESKKQ